MFVFPVRRNNYILDLTKRKRFSYAGPFRENPRPGATNIFEGLQNSGQENKNNFISYLFKLRQLIISQKHCALQH